jgi:hypothetical protein
VGLCIDARSCPSDHSATPPRASHAFDLVEHQASLSRRAIQFLQAQNSPWLERITRQRGARTERLFWQSGGGYDRNIVCARTLLQMIDYLHLIPVRKGLVEFARDWKWSSTAYFEGGTSRIPLDPIPSEWLAC